MAGRTLEHSVRCSYGHTEVVIISPFITGFSVAFIGISPDVFQGGRLAPICEHKPAPRGAKGC